MVYCDCVTYEYAYYMQQELRKYNWDKSKIKEIKEAYPKWYTWLLDFYRYINPAKKRWCKKDWMLHLLASKNGKQEQLYFSRLEDALWERDLYVKYDYDLDTIVYLADDRQNPYYDMELPPFPERRIRKNITRNPHKKELNELADYIRTHKSSTLQEFCQLTSYCPTSIHNWLKHYNSNIDDFKRIIRQGVDPWSVLELEPLVFKPDLSIH